MLLFGFSLLLLFMPGFLYATFSKEKAMDKYSYILFVPVVLGFFLVFLGVQ